MATFGYDTFVPPGTNFSTDNIICASKFTMPVDGQVTKITAYIYMAQFTGGKCAIYDAALNLRAQSAEYINLGAAVAEWHDFNVAPGVDLLAGDYWICFWGSLIGVHSYYDAGDANQWGQKAQAYGAWSNPIVWDSQAARKLAIYATYTPAAGPAGGSSRMFGMELTLTL